MSIMSVTRLLLETLENTSICIMQIKLNQNSQVFWKTFQAYNIEKLEAFREVVSFLKYKTKYYTAVLGKQWFENRKEQVNKNCYPFGLNSLISALYNAC